MCLRFCNYAIICVTHDPATHRVQCTCCVDNTHAVELLWFTRLLLLAIFGEIFDRVQFRLTAANRTRPANVLVILNGFRPMIIIFFSGGEMTIKNPIKGHKCFSRGIKSRGSRKIIHPDNLTEGRGAEKYF